MSLIVLSTGHEVPVEQDPQQARETVEQLVDRGHDWGFSELTGAQFQLRHIVAILPDRELSPAKPRTRRAVAAA